MRIAICEDNIAHAQILSRYINGWAKHHRVTVLIVCYKSAEEFLLGWSKDNTFDLAFLDIELNHTNGLELAYCIRKQDQGMLLVFTTGLQNYVFRGYEVRAFRYMLKPIKEKECMKTLDAAYQIISNQNDDTFAIVQETQSIRLFKRDIYYFEMDNHYVIVHTTRGTYRYKERLSHIASLFGEPRFCKCHRSYVVNLEHVSTINENKVEIDNGDILQVSRARWQSLNQCFISYYVTLKDKYQRACREGII